MRLARVASLAFFLTLFCFLDFIQSSNVLLDLTEDNGSGDKEEEDDKNSFLLETRDSTDDTGDDDSPASDDESEEESEEHVDTASSVLEKEDDEAKKQLTAATPKDKDADKDKESPTNEDENDDGRTSSEESDKDAEEGSGELEERNIETSTGSSRVAHETIGEDVEEEDDVTTKKQSKRSKWQYYGTYGPGNWSKEFIGCSNSDHRFQSPINIVLEQTHFDDTREKITFTTKHTAEKSNSLLLNDAKTAKVVFQHMTVRVNGLERVYKVAWVQFRWGDANNIGSEHVIEGKRYPLEMQVLCYDEENFPDVIEAELVEDKNNTSSTIVILATLFEISDKDNQPLSSVAENLKSIQSPGQNISIPSLDLQGLLPKKSEYFYRYSGSLTSPPCQGGAEWIVFHELQTISASQLAEFRQLHEEDFEDGNYITIDYNWRPLQPLDGRVVTRSFPNPKKKVNQKTPKPSAVKTSKSSSHRSPAIDISVYTLLFAWKLFLG